MAIKDAIMQALAQLDQTNDEHWTDDGLPRTSVVQRLANDPEIRRTDIQAVAPSFMRKPGDAQGDPQETVTSTGQAAEPGSGGGGAPATADVPASDATDLKAEALARLNEAEFAVLEARKGLDDARKVERAAINELDAAKLNHSRQFPPLTAAENIKQHLASEARIREARVQHQGTNVYGKDNIDVAMNGRHPKNGRRSEYARPNRPLVGVAR
jgi:hypothetical protein